FFCSSLCGRSSTGMSSPKKPSLRSTGCRRVPPGPVAPAVGPVSPTLAPVISEGSFGSVGPNGFGPAPPGPAGRADGVCSGSLVVMPPFVPAHTVHATSQSPLNSRGRKPTTRDQQLGINPDPEFKTPKIG